MGGSGAKEPSRSPTCGAWRRGGRSADAACVGYVVVQRSSLVASVAKLVVMPACRRQGIGRLLLVQAVEASRAARAQACTLHVDEANAPAATLYTSVGFTVTNRRADYYALGRHALAMQLDLELH